VAADANDLPFADGSFDCAVMFSALHHFADPIDVLPRLARLVKRDGFLAIMCEPVGCYFNGEVDAEVSRELEQGINEQGKRSRAGGDKRIAGSEEGAAVPVLPRPPAGASGLGGG
jgi:SAM-dependent methyltransferase